MHVYVYMADVERARVRTCATRAGDLVRQTADGRAIDKGFAKKKPNVPVVHVACGNFRPIALSRRRVSTRVLPLTGA